MTNICKIILVNSGNCQTIACYWNNLILPLLYAAQGKGVPTYSGKRTEKKEHLFCFFIIEYMFEKINREGIIFSMEKTAPAINRNGFSHRFLLPGKTGKI